MNDVRKLSIGNDHFKAMVYVVGQNVVQNTCAIHRILENPKKRAFEIYVQREDEIILWKSVSMNTPYTVEYNIDFQ